MMNHIYEYRKSNRDNNKLFILFSGFFIVAFSSLFLFYLFKNINEYNMIVFYQVAMFMAIQIFVISPLHELIHYIFLKKYGGVYKGSLSFIVGSIVLSNNNIQWKWTGLCNSYIEEISEHRYTIKQYKTCLIMPFTIFSFTCFIYLVLTNNYLIFSILITLNVISSQNDIFEFMLLFKFNNSFLISMFNNGNKSSVNPGNNKKRDFIGFRVYKPY